MEVEFMRQFIQTYLNTYQVQSAINERYTATMLEICISKMTVIKQKLENRTGDSPVSPSTIDEMIQYCQLIKNGKPNSENNEQLNQSIMKMLVCCQMMESILETDNSQNIEKKPEIRRISREEFFRGPDKDAENYSSEWGYSERNTEYPNTLADESRLYRLGYSVARNSSLTDKARKELLKKLIDEKKMEKDEIISFLKHLIKVNGQSEKNYLAVKKWQSDLNYVIKL